MTATNIRLNTGKEIPAIGFGTWKLEEGSETEDSVSEALKTGYRLIDTAKIYGNEESVGRAVTESGFKREEVFVTSKLWTSDMGYKSALDACNESLEKLGMDYLDLYLMHWPGHDKKLRQDSWEALLELKKLGKAKAIGVSNYTVEHLEELESYSSVLPSVNQIPFNPFVYERQKPILDWCKKKGIVVEAYSPLSRMMQAGNPVINKIADNHAKTFAQILLRWSIQHGTLPIPKSAHSERIKSNLEVFDFELTDKDMAALNDLS